MTKGLAPGEQAPDPHQDADVGIWCVQFDGKLQGHKSTV